MADDYNFVYGYDNDGKRISINTRDRRYRRRHHYTVKAAQWSANHGDGATKSGRGFANIYKEELERGSSISAQTYDDPLPLPNVVRIDILPEFVRQNYLGGVTGVAEVLQAAVLAFNSPPDAFLPFYGIIDDSTTITFGVSSTWDRPKDTGADAAVSKLVQKNRAAAEDVVKGVAEGAKFGTKLLGGGLAAIGGFPLKAVWGALGGKITEAVGNMINDQGMNLVSTLANDDNKLTNLGADFGITYRNIGGQTIKAMTSSKVDAIPSVSCTWYMPEQEHQCRLGVSRLMSMAYYRPAVADSGQKKSLSTIMQEAIKAAGQAALDMAEVDNVFARGGVSLGTDLAGLWTFNELQTTLPGYLLALFGAEQALTPLPVRLRIGHVFDMEPLVISSVKVTCSKERFVTTDGTTIPMTVSATISFEPWLNPGPNHDFMSFLGDSMYGSYEGVGFEYSAPNVDPPEQVNGDSNNSKSG